MVIPPFAPPQYVDSPAYVLPHPHIQPVDYRRFLHPQVPPPTAPYQNPNPLRRIRPPQAASVRETVNSAVQTDPAQRNVGRHADGSPPIRSDSGHGTTSDSPSSSSSSSQKRASDSLTSDRAKDVQPPKTGKKGTGKHGGDVLGPPPVSADVPSCIGTAVERQRCRKASVDPESVPPYKSSHCHVWSVGSPDGLLPVCSSSQQEDEVIKERRVSFPDILMSWGGGTPKEAIHTIPDKVFDPCENQLPTGETVEEQEESACKSPSATDGSVVLGNSDVDDSENVLWPQKLPAEPRGNEPLGFGDSTSRPLPDNDLLHSRNLSAEREQDETILSEEPAEVTSHPRLSGSSRLKGRPDESVWSVESLPPFVPPKEFMFQKNNVDSQIIIETAEETENEKEASKHGDLEDKSRKRRLEFYRISSSDSVPASTSWLDFSTPAQRAASLPKEAGPPGPKPGQVASPAAEIPIVLATPPPCDGTPPAEEAEQDWSSEPEAHRSPNQEVIVEKAEQEQGKCASPVSAVGELVLQNGAEPETCGSGGGDLAEGVSPPKGHMVDCGIQCTSLLSYPHAQPRRYALKHSGEVTTF